MKQKHMRVSDLGDRVNLTRSGIHQRIKADGVETWTVPCKTPMGVRDCKVVPLDYATKLIQRYEDAHKNSTPTKGKGK